MFATISGVSVNAYVASQGDYDKSVETLREQIMVHKPFASVSLTTGLPLKIHADHSLRRLHGLFFDRKPSSTQNVV